MFKLEIETVNAAFDDDDGRIEIARLLRETAERIEGGARQWLLLDINSNTVGTVHFHS